MERHRKSIAVYAAALSVGACSSSPGIKLPSPVRVHSQDQAATVLVTASMVAPWANVSASLKPAFTMTGDTAVTEVLPTTEQIQNQVLNAFGASLGIGLPGSSTTGTSGETSNTAHGSNTAGGVTTTTASNNGTTTSSTTTTTSPGVAPTPPTGTPAGGQLPTAPALSGGLSLDPVLKYKAAAYLNQEVQLLNQEIDNAAVRECYVPYVVKLKLAVMNYRPYLAYSVHTRVSFGEGAPGEYPPTDEEVMRAEKTLQAAGLLNGADATSSTPSSPPNPIEANRRLQLQHTSSTCLGRNHSPVVVPFLVADDMEVALKSRAAEAAQQIAFALNFMIHGVGGNVGLNNVNSQLTAISSQDLASALTVSRDNDSTLYIRIAPNNEASGDPSLVGQTYDIAVLLLVPRRYFVWDSDRYDPAPISLVSYTQFRDATSGDILAVRPSTQYVADLDRVLRPFLLADSQRNDWWKALSDDDKIKYSSPLVFAIEEGNPSDFRANLTGGANCSKTSGSSNLCLSPLSAPSLWTSLGSVLTDNSFKSAVFEAPVPAKITIPDQRVLVSDDSTHPISVLVSGVGGTSAATLAAHLDLSVRSGGTDTTPNTVATSNPPSKPGTSAKQGTAPKSDVPAPATPPTPVTVSVPAQTLTLDPVAHVLTLTFPSLGKSGLSMPKPPTKPANPAPKPPKKSAPPPGDESPMLVPDAQNFLVIEQVNCDPLKSLCPDIDKLENGALTPQVGVQPSISLRITLATASTKPPATSIAKLSAVGTSITIARGTSNGILPIVVSTSSLPTGDTLALTITGAPVVAASTAAGAALQLNKNGYVLPQTGAYTVNLVNLTPGAVITASVQAIKPDGTTPDGDPATATYTAIAPIDSRP